MEKYQYTVTFMSTKDEAKKNVIVQKIQNALKQSVVDGTIEANTNAIQVTSIEVVETYPIYQA